MVRGGLAEVGAAGARGVECALARVSGAGKIDYLRTLQSSFSEMCRLNGPN
jgi:hypothetical protein